LLQESFKKLRAAEVLAFESTQEIPSNDPKEMNEEDVLNMLEIFPVSEFKVETLQVKYPIIVFQQVKYPIIDWEIHTEVLLDKVGAAAGVLKIYSKSLVLLEYIYAYQLMMKKE
nr:hypothetical protein [Tanacetum cinerariifolium]